MISNKQKRKVENLSDFENWEVKATVTHPKSNMHIKNLQIYWLLLKKHTQIRWKKIGCPHLDIYGRAKASELPLVGMDHPRHNTNKYVLSTENRKPERLQSFNSSFSELRLHKISTPRFEKWVHGSTTNKHLFHFCRDWRP